MQVVNNFNCRGFGHLLEDKLCLIFKLAPSVCRMTFTILASLLVFFFQAEDGIRDTSVTGVQTCALPIWACCGERPGPSFRPSVAAIAGATRLRSEERRVGKECRACRWPTILITGASAPYVRINYV